MASTSTARAPRFGANGGHAYLQMENLRRPDGESFVRRSEMLHDSPADEPDPRKLRTTVTIEPGIGTGSEAIFLDDGRCSDRRGPRVA